MLVWVAAGLGTGVGSLGDGSPWSVAIFDDIRREQGRRGRRERADRLL